MIAARQIAFGGSAKKWENPYITDGLVAMWDGEWNAGWGKHDPSATVWKDLVGGLDIPIPQSFVWEDNCLVPSKNVLTQTDSDFVIEEDSNYTVEAVFQFFYEGEKPSNYEGAQGASIEIGRLWNCSSFPYGTHGVWWGSYQVFKAPYRYPDRSPTANLDNMFKSSRTVIGVDSYSNYIDMKKRNANEMGADKSEQPIKICARVGEIFKLKISSLRVYNRKLEDSHNYEIDKVRFGL